MNQAIGDDAAAVLREAVAAVRAGVQVLLSAGLRGLDGSGVAGLVAEVEGLRRRLDAVDARLLAEAGMRAVAGEYGRTSTVDLLVNLVHTAPAEARERVARAGLIGPRVTLTGEGLAPLLPETSAAVAAGVISVGHVQVIGRCLEQVDRIGGITVEDVTVAEKVLVEIATHEHPRVLARCGRELLTRLDPDGQAPREAELCRRRYLTLIRHSDGSATVRGLLTPAAAAKWQAILDTLSTPAHIRASAAPDLNAGAARPSAGGAVAGGAVAGAGAAGDAGEAPGRGGTAGEIRAPDQRTAGQRRHDALDEVADRVLRSGDLPDCGGVPLTVLIRIGWRDYLTHVNPATPNPNPNSGSDASPSPDADLSPDPDPSPHANPNADLSPDPDPSPHANPNAAGHAKPGLDPGRRATLARTAYGEVVSAQAVLDSCESQLAMVVSDDSGRVLAFGRSRRLASRSQRLALAERDGGCSFPGCDRPPAWTVAHHVIAYERGGRTDLANLCLLCRRHHHSFQATGWSVTMTDGLPYWTPPAWIDRA